MIWKDAQALITESRKLGYQGTDWERGLIARLELLRPAVLTSQDAQSLTTIYRRASGGDTKVFRKYIGTKRRYIPEDY